MYYSERITIKTFCTIFFQAFFTFSRKLLMDLLWTTIVQYTFSMNFNRIYQFCTEFHITFSPKQLRKKNKQHRYRLENGAFGGGYKIYCRRRIFHFMVLRFSGCTQPEKLYILYCIQMSAVERGSREYAFDEIRTRTVLNKDKPLEI